MDINTEREQLHRTIWRIADELRGSVDGWDFKSYILGFLFYRFICENLIEYINSLNKGTNYSDLDDKKAQTARERILNAKGFFILPSDLFEVVLRDTKDSNNLATLNERLNTAFNNIQNSSLGSESEENFRGLFKDIDVNADKLGTSPIERNKKLLKIMQEISKLELSYANNSIDAFGDAYEFLMTMYASNAGKSGGEFFTPQEVSELLTKITLHNNPSPNKVYDPACGSGSLLLQYKKILHKDPKLGYYGQEINLTTYNLARMNMFLHNVGYEKFHIALGDTLIKPCEGHREQEPFDAIVSNPPYSTKWEGKDNPLLINDERYSKAGVLAPNSKADFAFIMHSLSWLSESGSAAIVCFPGIMYRTGAEQKIRQYLITNNYIDSIIALSDNLFFGTGIAVCIMVLRKNKISNDICFINASDEFIKATNKNKLSNQNIESILSLYKERKNIPYKVAVVSNEEVAKNDHNLSVSSYVEAEDTREAIDIVALNEELNRIVARQNALRKQIDEIVSELEG
ncbi:type I restriction-modification system subunit M [Helicobacter didelphidarum]|uniref:site-specific DNA-methyltransferase (adenine-specific) n=1 Tax=Helicobacter didelphidarum TaxID=2040648 RepID=A0A3D8IHL3_9HELI|nr:type I restriction-modification system subunit M [Helicobacter didelphidarum]RDU64618.1 type I restriction-modification system subunit M [Helicobacter didelphidarum]